MVLERPEMIAYDVSFDGGTAGRAGTDSKPDQRCIGRIAETIMARIKFSFARGGHFMAKVMLDKAPKTWEAIRKQLPLTIKAYNARWTGRETHTKLDLPNKPPRENQNSQRGARRRDLRL